MSNMLQATLAYHNSGYIIIPIREKTEGDQEVKKPYVYFEDFKSGKDKPTERDIKTWWSKWNNAMIGIITGSVNKITVIDFDIYNAETKQLDELAELFPGFPSDIQTPIAITPRGGYHFYFNYNSKIPHKAKILPNVDGRNDGGYIIAPPSVSEAGEYKWIEGKRPSALPFSEIPEQWLKVILEYNNINSLYKGNVDRKNILNDNTDNNVNKDNIPLDFNKGSRDQTIFNIANTLSRGGWSIGKIQEFLLLINASFCNPPLPEKEVIAKLESVLTREERKNRNLTQEVRDIICQHSGIITTTFVQQLTTLSTREEKKQLSVILGRLEQEELIKKTGNKAGEYRIIDKRVDVTNINDVKHEEPINIKLPFGLEMYCNIMKGNLIIFSGVTNGGKSAMMLEMVRLNMFDHTCNYFSSEMSKSLIKRRIDFHKETKYWNFNVVDGWHNNVDVLRPGELNFIDWIEEEEAWRVKARLTEVQAKIGNGIGIVALQKNPNANVPWGGAQTLNKSALAFMIDFIDPEDQRQGVKMKIIKCKEPKDEINPINWVIEYKTYKGINFYPQGSWGPEMDKKYRGLVK